MTPNQNIWLAFAGGYFYDYDLLLGYSGWGWNLHYFEFLQGLGSRSQYFLYRYASSIFRFIHGPDQFHSGHCRCHACRLGANLVFTLLPAKNKDWNNAEGRV